MPFQPIRLRQARIILPVTAGKGSAPWAACSFRMDWAGPPSFAILFITLYVISLYVISLCYCADSPSLPQDRPCFPFRRPDAGCFRGTGARALPFSAGFAPALPAKPLPSRRGYGMIIGTSFIRSGLPGSSQPVAGCPLPGFLRKRAEAGAAAHSRPRISGSAKP